VPAFASMSRAPDRLVAFVDHLRGAPAAAKRHLYDLVGRTPSAGSEEAVAGAGGAALGTKIVVGLCVSAAAGGGALCVNQLGDLFPPRSGPHRPAVVKKRPGRHARTRVKAAAL